jgi:hypothetical protein
MGFGHRAFLAGGLGFAAAFVVACGGGNGLLSANDSSNLVTQLDSVSSALVAHQCGEVSSAATALNNAVANLPPSITTTLLQNLGQGASTVQALASRQCTSSSSSSATSTPTTSSSSSSASTSSTTPTSVSTSSSQATATGTRTTPNTGTATNPTTPGTSSTSNGGAGLGGTGTAGNGGN